MARARRSAYARLFAEPQRFRFDAAVRVLTRAARTADPAEAARFRTAPGFGYPAAEVTALEPAKDSRAPELTTGVIGLTGAAGVLPRMYTEVLTTTLRNRSHALHDFLDMLSNRIVAMFAGAGIKYRLNRSAEAAVAAGAPQEDRVAEALLALTGFATPHLVPRLAVGVEPLLHYSGFLSGRPRSAERLTALLSDWLGRNVEVVQFAGAWLPLPATSVPRSPWDAIRGRGTGLPSMQPSACAPGTRKPASSCASVRSITRALRRCFRITPACNASCRWSAPSSATKPGSP